MYPRRRPPGHPPGLAVLFLLELWERFSYYGMRSLLVLFMTASAADGGLGFSVPLAGMIFGLYAALSFMAGIPGGWLADRILGQRRAVLCGGVVIMLGHVCLTIPGLRTFYGGLGLLVIGTGLLKPSVLPMLGSLYADDDPRRDAGFAIFYTCINVGAALAPLLCGFLAQSDSFRALLLRHGLSPQQSWHWGFGAAALGMSLGLFQYLVFSRHLGGAGAAPPPAVRSQSLVWVGIGLGALAALMTGTLALQELGAIHLGIEAVVSALGAALVLLPCVYFPLLWLRGGFDAGERRSLLAVLVLVLFTILFWGAFEQAGTSLSLFAQRHTSNVLWGRPFPSVYWQSLSATLIIALAPTVGWLWTRLGRRAPSSLSKFTLGMVLVSLAFLVMTGAALRLRDHTIVGPGWLFTTYLLCALGELCLSPVALSLVSRLAPPRAASQIMGAWFVAVSLGSLLGGRVSGLFESLPLPRLFGAISAVLCGAGLGLLCLRGPMHRLMGGRR